MNWESLIQMVMAIPMVKSSLQGHILVMLNLNRWNR